MTPPTPDLAEVVARLEKVERELLAGKRRNRCLLVAGGLGLVGVALVWTLATIPPPAQAQGRKVIRANQFIVEDENGNSRAGLNVTKDWVALALNDETDTSPAPYSE